ncbi:MAG: glycosyltransferase family 39 protein [Desulfobacterales bacterium]
MTVSRSESWIQPGSPEIFISLNPGRQSAYQQAMALFQSRGWLLLWGLVLIGAIHCRPLMPIDETRYLSVAWEMWQQGDFLVPHSNGVPYSHKPPLLFWSIHLSWLLFGVNEVSARMVAPLFGLANLVLSARLARRLWPQEPGVSMLVPFVLLALPFWTVSSTLTMFDMPLTFFVLCATLGMLWVKDRRLWRGWGLAALALG